MKKITISATVFLVVSLFQSCSFSIGESIKTLQPRHTAQPAGNSSTQATAALSYGNSVVYLQNAASNLLAPVVRPQQEGVFMARPDGLSIDPQTGIIDMSSSETGMWFSVSFRDTRGNILVEQPLMISGIDYKSGVYYLNRQSVLMPCYNADLSQPLPPGLFTSSAHPVDALSGAIDLKAVLQDSKWPAGSLKKVEVQYRLNDQSEQAGNKIQLQLYHFRRIEDIPPSLLQSAGRTEEEDYKRRPPVIMIITN